MVGVNSAFGGGLFAAPAALLVAAGTFSSYANLIFTCPNGVLVEVAANLSTVIRQFGVHQLYAELFFGPADAISAMLGWQV